LPCVLECTYLFMKKIFIYTSLLLMLVACGRPAPRKTAKPPLTTEVLIKTTPVKDQGRSQLCWAYAMLATIESEHLMMGDSVNLSTDYVARMMLLDQTRQYYLSRGEHVISMRGMCPMLIHYIETYGAMPFDSYNSKSEINYQVLGRKLMRMTASQHSLSGIDALAATMMDHEIEYLPKIVFMLGAEYTPLEFAHSVCRVDEYVSLTSFTHHPFYQKFVLEVPDNQMHDEFMNLPIDTLMARIKHTLRTGHPVCWEGDISEPGFSFAQGIAVTGSHRPCTQAERQRQFESLRTTDDHCMELIGIARSRKGHLYFIAKNSWGTANPFGGMMYLSENYVRLKTIAVYMKKKK
jgi:aminopeptidase C